MTRTIRFIVLAGVALTAASIVLLHTGADATSLGTLLLFAPRRFVPLAWLLLAIALVWRHRGLALISVSTAAASLFLLAGFRLPSPHAPGGERTLRVVSWNVDYARTLEPRLGLALARWQADVVLLQGCTESIAGELSRHRGADGAVMQFWEFCVLTKVPILGVGHVAAQNPKEPQWTRPIALRMRAVVAHDTIDLLSVHLHSPRDELAAAMRGDLSRLPTASSIRDEHARLLADRVRNRRRPMLLVGDFNIPPESVIYERHFGVLANAFHETGWGFGHTMRAGPHRLRIDHALASEELEFVRFDIEPDWPTEHVPLIVDVRRR